jgi:hypothetical protein
MADGGLLNMADAGLLNMADANLLGALTATFGHQLLCEWLHEVCQVAEHGCHIFGRGLAFLSQLLQSLLVPPGKLVGKLALQVVLQ